MILRGLAASPQDRFASARDMCVALSECGSPASAMTVGDWVHQTAAAALADRAQRVAALESAPSGTLRGVGPSDRPSTARRPKDPEIPVVADTGTQLSAVAALEKTFRGGVRRRVAAVAGATGIVALVVTAYTGGEALRRPPRCASGGAPALSAPAPQASARAVVVPAPAQTMPELDAWTPPPPMPSTPNPGAARPPAGARPASPRRPTPRDDAVFESRQ